jgi:tetratricopeptide (TPR) repeat protein
MDIPKTLRDRLRDGKVIPFVGAGVSMSVLDTETDRRLFPSWRELLEGSANRLEEENNGEYAEAVRALLRLPEPDYLEIARQARKGLGESLWYKFLKDQFDYPRERAKTESLKLAQAIWDLKSQLVITTNYDDVLRWALPPDTHPESWNIEAPAEMADFLGRGAKRPTIWHLHGEIHNKAEIILTRDGYALLYPEASDKALETPYKAALHTLRSLLATHTFLFVGFSMDDAYFGMQLEGIKSIYQGANGPHYVLAHKNEAARVASFGDAVKVIPFEDFGQPLIEVVKELGEIASRRGDSVTTPPTPIADYNPRTYVFSVPFRQKGDQVIGREEALQAVRKQLTKGRRTAIGQAAAFQGLGGLGKTQLAVEYAYLFKDSYPNGVIWLNADQDIDAQLTDLAEKARWIAPESEHKYKLQVALHRLRSSSDCLIIFDNLEDPQAIANYLPEPQAEPHVLVTSRIDQPDFTPIPLDPLNNVLSFDLLTQEAEKKPEGDEEEKAAREIAASLGGLPLALELAGAYLKHRQISWQRYRELLRHNLRGAMPDRVASFTGHKADLYSTLKINEEVFNEVPKLKEILDLLTWSGSAPMGESLMCALLNATNPIELTPALGLGTALRLLQKTPDTESYSIHRLVSEVRREEILLQEHQDWVNTISQRIGDWFEARKEDYTELSRFEAEIDHLQAWQEHAGHYAPEHSSRLIWLQAYPSYHQGHYQETKNWVEKALTLFEQANKSNLELKAHLLNDLGFCCGSLGDYKRSLEYNEKVLELRLELFGERHPDTANSFNSVGATYNHLGDYKRALEYCEKALELRLELFGEPHPDTASSFNIVSAAYNHLGDYKRALEYSEKALELRLELFGERHPHTASSFDSVGSDYISLEDYKRGLEYSQKALEILLELFGERHPDTANSFNSVSTVYSRLEDYKRALEYSEKALELRLELFGEPHPATASSFHSVSIDYSNLGDHKRALEYSKKAFELRLELLGDKHPDTIFSVKRLVNLLVNLNRRLEAVRLLEKYLPKLSKDDIQYDELKKLEQGLLATTIRPGFRQPSSKTQERSKKNRKKKH